MVGQCSPQEPCLEGESLQSPSLLSQHRPTMAHHSYTMSALGSTTASPWLNTGSVQQQQNHTPLSGALPELTPSSPHGAAILDGSRNLFQPMWDGPRRLFQELAPCHN